MISSLFKCVKLSVVMLFLVAVNLVNAQEPIQVSVTVLPPTPNYAYEVVDMGDQIIITLQNTDFANSYSLKLGIELSGSNGILVRSKDDALPNQSIDLGPGENLVFTGDELSAIYNGYSEADFDFIGISPQDVANDQQLPDGTYTLCMRAYDYTTGLPLSASAPTGCSAPFIVMAIDPPVISYPQNQTTITPVEPQLLNINWIPVTIASPDLRYKLELVDLTDMNMNPYDAFLTSDFLLFFEDDIITNTFLYGMEHPLLLKGHEYAARVKAYSDMGAMNVKNDGYSDIITFTYGDSVLVTTVDSSVVTELPSQGLNCGTSCTFTLTGNEVENKDIMRKNSMIKFGNFDMKITDLSGQSPYTGEGVIQATTYMPVQVRVKFKGLKIDSTHRVIAGEASAIIRKGSWIDATWADVKTMNPKIEVDEYGTKWEAATNPDFYIDNLVTTSQTLGTTIPISIGYEDNSIQVVGMNFFPDRASFNLSYISKLADSPTGKESYLHFMAKDLCLTPDGPALSAEEARLNLVKTFTYQFDNYTALMFKPADTDSTGTYLAFDCDGFVGVHAVGNVKFNPEVFTPVTTDGNPLKGDTVVASFSTNYTNWSDWVAFVSFDNVQAKDAKGNSENLFMYNQLEDYIFRVQSAYIDHSINENVPNMEFPENYGGSPGADWQGFYIDSLRIDLPVWIETYNGKGGRVSLNGYNLIVDGNGLTGVISASNVLPRNTASLGKWPFSIDSLSVVIDQNRLMQGFINGGLTLPVAESDLGYMADISFSNHLRKTQHTFRFNTLDAYRLSTWFASIQLGENSALRIDIEKGEEPFIEASLHGTISFDTLIDGIKLDGLTNIGIEGLKIRNKKKPRYIEIDNILTPEVENMAMAGFGLAMSSLGWDEKSSGDGGVSMGLDLDLLEFGDSNKVSGGTKFLLKNVMKAESDSVKYEFDGTEIKEIYIQADLGAVSMLGKVAFFKDDADFGNGFSGSLKLDFVSKISVEGEVLIGSKEVDNEELNYWYAFGMVSTGATPIPFITPLDIYGFGGGAYYNLALKSELPSPTKSKKEAFDPKKIFEVQKGIMGLKASMVVGLTPSTETFNADVTLSVEINTTTGSLNNIRLTGNGYILESMETAGSSASSSGVKDAMITASVDIKYDHIKKELTGLFDAEGKVPKQTPLLKFNGKISFLISPDLWYFKVGEPGLLSSKESNGGLIEAELDYGIINVAAGAYFMTGMDLPRPVLPVEVTRFFTFEPNITKEIAEGLGIGLAAGVHFRLNVDLGIVDILGLAGADVAITNYYAALCADSDGNTREDFGVNKWYAEGMGYVYADFDITIIAELASLKLGLMVETALPNPSGVRGQIKATATILGQSKSIDETFEVGSFCNMIPHPDINLMVEQEELELESMNFIGTITPGSMTRAISVQVQPQIQYHKKRGDFERFIYSDGMGGIVDKLFRFTDRTKWFKEQEDGGWRNIEHGQERDTSDAVITLIAQNSNRVPALLHGSTNYKIRAEVKVEEYKGPGEDYYEKLRKGSIPTYGWKPALYLEGTKTGQPIVQVKENIFTTQSSMSEIDRINVAYTLPYDRQRYYPYGFYENGKVNFKEDHKNKFEDIVDVCGFDLKAEFEPINGGNKQVFNVTRENLAIRFDMKTLSPATVYKMEIVAQRDISPNALAAETNENCKIRNQITLQSLIDEYGLSAGNNTQPALGTMLINHPGMQNVNQAQQQLNRLQGGETITQRKVLYEMYFGTSKYATPQEKMQNVGVLNIQTESVPGKPGVKVARAHLYCDESFDVYDIFGDPYHSIETAPTYAFLGPGCLNSNLTGSVNNWYQTNCQYGFGSNTSSGNSPKSIQSGGLRGWGGAAQQAKVIDQPDEDLGKVKFVADASNPTGVKHIKPPLSDSEVGLSTPVTTGQFDMSNFNTLNNTWTASSTSSSSSTGSSGGGNSTSNGSTGGNGFGSNGFSSSSYGVGAGVNFRSFTSSVPLFTPLPSATSLVSSLVKLEIVFRADEIAYNQFSKLKRRGRNVVRGKNYVNAPSGNYPVIMFMGKVPTNNFWTPNDLDPSAVKKVLNLNINF